MTDTICEKAERIIAVKATPASSAAAAARIVLACCSAERASPGVILGRMPRFSRIM